ncbi:unnamed protein product [Ilex paraguariensis]|uniref:SOSEKI DIX-like domain-containing protein n=1 Tax=Ilex paraguariensis TaxID=185542 RepID=A0ABC8TC50_9AQUA
MSPDRAKVCAQPRPRVIKPTFRKVQVVYYLSRNGQLEHPHFMEVTHLAHQQLRLKDVIDRLTVLRGKGMPSLYSWSCKRSYKNGYVWNDLAETDIIYPSEGAEYVLKGSELLQGCTEKLQQLQVGNAQEALQEPVFNPKRKPLATKRHPEPEEVENNRYQDEDENEEDEEEYEEKTSYTSSNTPQSRCSRGVSTDEHELQQETHKNPSTELTLENSSPPSTTSSTHSDKPNESKTSNNTSKRFEDGDPLPTESVLNRNSVLLQLISCGGSVSFRGKGVPVVTPTPRCTVARKSSSSSLHKGVLCKTAAAKVVLGEEDEINCMSENPRFGNLQSEEKEYFSGSIVESMTQEKVHVEPGLKKSSSYNEERSSKAGIEQAVEEEEPKREKALGNCIPRKKPSSKQSKK